MTTIITKNSSTASAVPLAADLVQGELAVNVTDKKLYTKNASGTVVEVTSTIPDGSVTPAKLSSTAQYTGFKNRIINGAMMIDQRNAGASVTLSSPAWTFPVDRFSGYEDTDGVMTAQQVSDAPAGFINSIKCTATTADASLGATQRVMMRQTIEGLNLADLAFGSASASTITISFWVKSSLTGTFGGSVQNGGSTRAYPFTYTISSANTWEQKSVTVAGDTTGTWLTTNGVGMQLMFGLGVGSTYSTTAGTWATGEYNSATGATSVIGTLNATWQLTGVQLEKGSTATSFDYRPYGTELALCQRYTQRWGGSYPYEAVGNAIWTGASIATAQVPYKVTMRTQPSLTTSGTWCLVKAAGGVQDVSTFSLDTNASGTQTGYLNLTTATGGTTGQATALLSSNSTSTSFILSAEL